MKLGSGIDLFSFLIRFFRYFVFFAKIYENDRLISSYIDDEWITTLQEPNRFSAIIGSTFKDFEIKAYAVVRCRFYENRNRAKNKIKSNHGRHLLPNMNKCLLPFTLKQINLVWCILQLKTTKLSSTQRLIKSDNMNHSFIHKILKMFWKYLRLKTKQIKAKVNKQMNKLKYILSCHLFIMMIFIEHMTKNSKCWLTHSLNSWNTLHYRHHDGVVLCCHFILTYLQ